MNTLYYSNCYEQIKYIFSTLSKFWNLYIQLGPKLFNGSFQWQHGTHLVLDVATWARLAHACSVV